MEVVLAPSQIPATIAFEADRLQQPGPAQKFKKEHTATVNDLIGLGSAVLASLAAGVLAAYGLCVVLFRFLGSRREPERLSVGAAHTLVAEV